MNEMYWLRCTRRQLLYIIEGCEIDEPLAEHWAKHFGKSPLIQGDGYMSRVIASLEKNAREALYRGPDCSKYPPGDERRKVRVKR